jgi:hypothetical protein
MDLDDWLYEDACRHLDFGSDDPFRSLEIWSFDVCSHWLQQLNILELTWPQTGLPLVRDVALKNGELSSWLKQAHAFKLPAQIANAHVTGSLRLLYQIWDPSNDLGHSDRMPMSKGSLDLLTTSLNLPRCFPLDFASRKPVPVRLKMKTGSTADSLGALPALSTPRCFPCD